MTSLLEFRVDGRFYLAFDVHENNLLGTKGPSHTDFKIGKYWELLSQMLPIIILPARLMRLGSGIVFRISIFTRARCPFCVPLG